MGHTSGALAPRNSAGCVRRRLYVIFLFTFDWRGSDPTPVGCVSPQRTETFSLYCTGTNFHTHCCAQLRNINQV